MSKEFTSGVACAAAYLARERDEPTLAADMLRGFGYTYQDLLDAGADEYDLAALKEEMSGEEPIASE